MSLPPNGQYWRGENYGEAAPPNSVIPEFFIQEVEVKQNGAVVSRFPREMVRFRCAGDAGNVPVQIVTDRHRQEYAVYYHAWKNQTGGEYGTPLENWNLLSADQVRILKASNIFTVEQMAGVSENFVGGIMGGPHMKRMAQQFVDQRRTRDEAERLKADKDESTKLLNMAFEQIRQLQDQLSAKAAPAAEASDDEDSVTGEAPRRGPGRPRKNPEQPAL